MRRVLYLCPFCSEVLTRPEESNELLKACEVPSKCVQVPSFWT